MSGELKPMEGSEVAGGIDNAPALRRQRDDFGGVPQTEQEAEAALRRELAIKPKYTSPCHTCGTVHAIEGYPMCLCVKCGKMGRIVHMGYCTACAYQRFSELANVDHEVLARMPIFEKYVQFLKNQDLEKAKENKEPWE